MKTLHIDTSNNKELLVSLTVDNKEDTLTRSVGREHAQYVLAMIEELLAKHDLEKKDITNITVHTGPGSFTGLRVGVAIANTLGTVLQIPINSKVVGETVEPIYSA